MTTQVIGNCLENIRAAEGTKRRYYSALVAFGAWAGHMPPEDDLEVNSFLRYLEGLGRSSSTVSVHLAALKRMLAFHRIPTDRLEKINVTLQAPEYLSTAEISSLMEAAATPLLQGLIALLYDSGARIGELLSAEVSSIDWDGGFIKVLRKGSRPDTLNVGNWGMGYLRKWLEVSGDEHPKIFGDWSYWELWRILKNAARTAGLARFHPHMLRHSRAVHLRQEGVDWVDIGYQLGHVRASKTQDIYARPIPADLKRHIPEVRM